MQRDGLRPTPGLGSPAAVAERSVRIAPAVVWLAGDTETWGSLRPWSKVGL